MADFNVKDFKVTFLGTSAASISPRSSTSASLIETGKTKVLVDAGIGVLRQLLKSGTSSEMLDAVLLTHWHLDHFAGLLRLVRSRKNSPPIPIYGPVPPFSTRIFLRATFQIFFQYFTFVRGPYQIDFPDIHAEAFNTIHRIPSIGWIIIEKSTGDRRIVFSGDTRPIEEIKKAAYRADLLVHEATYLERHSKRAIIHRHSTAVEAARLAVKSEVGGLALTHIPSRYSLKAIRMEVEKIFPEVIIPRPMDVISVEPLTGISKKEGFGWANLKVQGRNNK